MRVARVLQLVRTLKSRPSVVPVVGLRVRNYQGPSDIDGWLALRGEAFAEEEFAVRAWRRADFRREFLEKSWWHAERMWLAESDEETGAAPHAKLIGTVTLGQRGAGPRAKPVVHWLAVLPEWRRRGVGSLMMAALESQAWDHGERQIWLDTHAQWRSALALYEARGYRPTDES